MNTEREQRREQRTETRVCEGHSAIRPTGSGEGRYMAIGRAPYHLPKDGIQRRAVTHDGVLSGGSRGYISGWSEGTFAPLCLRCKVLHSAHTHNRRPGANSSYGKGASQ